MQVSEKIYLGTLREIDPVKTFECGQCFRWNMGTDGAYPVSYTHLTLPTICSV